jgi:hypothetical protein
LQPGGEKETDRGCHRERREWNDKGAREVERGDQREQRVPATTSAGVARSISRVGPCPR